MIDATQAFANAAKVMGDTRDRLRFAFAMNVFAARTAKLRKDIADTVTQDNNRAAMLGLDINEQSLLPTKRQQDPDLSRRLGDGPALAPHWLDSRVVSMFRVDMTDITGELLGSNGTVKFDIVGSWPGAPWLRFHQDTGQPRTKLPIRDVVGLRPTTVAKIQGLVQDWAKDIKL